MFGFITIRDIDNRDYQKIDVIYVSVAIEHNKPNKQRTTLMPRVCRNPIPCFYIVHGRNGLFWSFQGLVKSET